MAHIDYLSFSFTPTPVAFEIASDDVPGRAVALLEAELGEEWCAYYLAEARFSKTTPMRPYSWAARYEEWGLEVHCHPSLPHAYVRLPGAACHYLNSRGRGVFDLAVARAERVTRIDLAHDFATPITPSEVGEAGFSPRIKSYSIVKSATGETLYLGARQSEKFTRVYKYEYPHERAGLLRVEMEYKGSKGKAIAAALGDGIPGIYWGEFDALGIIALAELRAASEDARTVSVPRTNPAAAGTYKWLTEVALPSIRKAIATGVLDKVTVMEYVEYTYSDIPF